MHTFARVRNCHASLLSVILLYGTSSLSNDVYAHRNYCSLSKAFLHCTSSLYGHASATFLLQEAIAGFLIGAIISTVAIFFFSDSAKSMKGRTAVWRKQYLAGGRKTVGVNVLREFTPFSI